MSRPGSDYGSPDVEKHLIETFGTIGLLVTIFAESSLIFFLPGDTLLFTAGLLASQGELNIGVVLVGSFVAAVAGNQVAYVVGARLGPSLFKPGSKLFKMEYVHRSEEYFGKYGSRTIVLARFIPAVRTFAPILAGIGSMRYRTFVTYNLLGALLWAVGVTLLGYTLGKTVHGIDKYLLPVILVIAALSAVPVYLEYRRSKRTTSPRGGGTGPSTGP
jgi:membrane-associated protein